MKTKIIRKLTLKTEDRIEYPIFNKKIKYFSRKERKYKSPYNRRLLNKCKNNIVHCFALYKDLYNKRIVHASFRGMNSKLITYDLNSIINNRHIFSLICIDMKKILKIKKDRHIGDFGIYYKLVHGHEFYSIGTKCTYRIIHIPTLSAIDSDSGYDDSYSELLFRIGER